MASPDFLSCLRTRSRRAFALAAFALASTAGVPAPGSTALAEAEPSTPRIASVWGEPADGSTVRILGTRFGTHPLDLAAAIGPGGWIEANAPGTPVSALRGADGWDVGQASGEPAVTDERAYSGGQSVLARVDFAADGHWQSVLRYHHPAGFDRLYATFWIRFEPLRMTPHRSTQWKFWRVNHNGTVSDQAGQIYLSSRHLPDGSVWDYQWMAHCALGCREATMRDCYARAHPTPAYAPRYGDPTQYRFLNRADQVPWERAHPERDRWNRVEIVLDRGTTDSADGSFTYRILDADSGVRFEEVVEGLLLRRSETTCRNPQERWHYVQWQNYWDDDGSHDAELFTDERADFYYDDLYLQFGTVARVELGDAPTLSDCLRREVQVPTSWNEKEITLRLNRGGFVAGDVAWLFVIDEEGRASPGMRVTLR